VVFSDFFPEVRFLDINHLEQTRNLIFKWALVPQKLLKLNLVSLFQKHMNRLQKTLTPKLVLPLNAKGPLHFIYIEKISLKLL